jgi:hypothetical protein
MFRAINFICAFWAAAFRLLRQVRDPTKRPRTPRRP